MISAHSRLSRLVSRKVSGSRGETPRDSARSWPGNRTLAFRRGRRRAGGCCCSHQWKRGWKWGGDCVCVCVLTSPHPCLSSCCSCVYTRARVLWGDTPLRQTCVKRSPKRSSRLFSIGWLTRMRTQCENVASCPRVEQRWNLPQRHWNSNSCDCSNNTTVSRASSTLTTARCQGCGFPPIVAIFSAAAAEIMKKIQTLLHCET